MDRKNLLSILDQVANDVTGELDLRTVCLNIARLVGQVIAYNTFLIALIDDAGRFDWLLQEGYEPDALDSLNLKADEGIIGRAVKNREIIAVNDVDTITWHVPVKTSSGKRIRSTLAVPLIHKDHAIGVIAMESSKVAAFSSEHQLLIRSIASHLASAVVNARLFEQTVEQIKVMRVIEQIGHEITSVLELDQVLAETARLVKQVIDYQAFGVFLVDRAKKEFVPRLTFGYDKKALAEKPILLDRGIRGKALKRRKPILVNDVLSDPNHVQYKLEINDVVRSQMVIPLERRHNIVGVLVLGNVRKDFYTNRHMRIAHGIATQIAIALENAQVFNQVAVSEERLRQNFEIARQMQLSMLPDCCPYIDGYEIQARSRPAVQVGGDFYDFIEIDDNRLGIIVGDVSGTGISAALVMASAREVIRIYAEFDPDPRAVMSRANDRLKRDLTKHMFVALIYGILDKRAATFTFCNASLVEPLLIRHKKAEFIPTEGTRMPLGKSFSDDFVPHTISLQEHDTLVLMTDGAIEAMSPEGEPFGYTNMLQTLSYRDERDPIDHARADDAITTLFRDLKRHAGTGEFLDDVTVLSVRRSNKQKNPS